MPKDIYYSDKYNDDTHEYRHVILPKVSFLQKFLHIFRILLYLGPCQARAKEPPDVWGWVEEPRSSAESGMDND